MSGYPHRELSDGEVFRRLAQRGVPADRARMLVRLREKDPAAAAEVARRLDR